VSDRGRIALAWGLTAFYMTAVWFLSSQSLELPTAILLPGYDKGAHLIEYTLLGILVASAALRTWPQRSLIQLVIITVLITAAWGTLDELHQAFVPGRSSDAFDLVADVIGGLCGAAMRLGVRAALRSHTA